MDHGFSWQEAYELLEAGEDPIQPKEFYKLLQRHGVIARKKTALSGDTQGNKV